MAAKGRKAQNIGHYNNKIVAQLLLDNPYSCIELSKKIKLTHTATGQIVDRLLDMDLIRVCVENISKRKKGRQHVRYEINPDRAFFVCVNFQNSLESFSICNLFGKILFKENLEHTEVDDVYLDELIEKINFRIKELNLPPEELAVISIAVPGRIDDEKGTVIVSSVINKEVNLKQKFQKSFCNAIVEIKNDIVYACTESLLTNEFEYGKGSHLYAYFGMGIACCLIYNGQVILGSNGFGGELGMNIVDGDGVHLYDLFSIESLLNVARKTLKKQDVTFNEFIQNCQTNDEIKNELLRIVNLLGVTIRNVVDIAGCSHIVFSGEITQFPKYFFEEFEKTLKCSNYSDKINYKVDLSKIEVADGGQRYLSRLTALDWVMSQY